MFDKGIKFLYFLGWYFVGMATFSYATRLSDLLEDDNLFQICVLGEKVLKKNNSDLKKLKEQILAENNYGLSFFCWHNGRDFYDCCIVLYHIELIKNCLLANKDEILALKSFRTALAWIWNSKEACVALYLIGKFPQSDVDFLLNFNFHDYIRLINQTLDEISNPKSTNIQQSSEPTDVVQPKTSCTLL